MWKIALVVSDFNKEITSKMELKAIEVAKKENLNILKNVHVNGAYDMPLVVKLLAEDKNIEAIVCIGAIIKGKTDHDRVIAQSLAKTLMEISLQTNKPILLGVIGPNATYKHAKERIGDYPTRAILAAKKMLQNIKNLKG